LAQEQQEQQSRGLGDAPSTAVPEKSKAYPVVDPPRMHMQHPPAQQQYQPPQQVQNASLVPSQVGGRGSPYANHAHMESSAGPGAQEHLHGYGHGAFEQHYNMDPPMNLSYRQQQPPQQHQQQMQEPYRRYGAENSMPTQAPILPVASSHPTYQQQQQPEQDYRKSSSTMSTSSFDSSSQKPKLPHGLTVHELKEMTKARLHAEASEKKDGGAGKPNESHSSVPSTVNVGQEEHRDPNQMSRSQVSPIPPVFHSQRMSSVSPYPDNLDQHNRFAHEGWSPSPESRGGADAWETASVCTDSSDYLPPDTFPANIHGGVHSVDDYSFNRTRSYSANNGSSNYAPHDLIPLQGGPGSNDQSGYYDGYPPNRRRAATLSPRPGLTHLHEDRPVLSGEGGPGIPSFSCSSSRRTHLPVRTRGAYNADAYHYARQRTSSTTSLPAYSHTAEEFEGSEANASLFSQFESLRVDDDAGHAVTGLVDVFRESPANYNGMTSPPPGLGGGDSDRFIMSTSSSNGFGSFGDERTRASTWSGHSSDFFGPGLFDSRNDDQDGLAGDLALILKLSGAEEKPDAVGSFYPPPGL
jgi:hypothetical protein